ncbi:hypothetical protein ACLKA6_004476 [Drosophila palustris]
MWFFIALFAIAAACGVVGRKWGRYLYLHYGRHLLPRSMLTAKNRSPTPPLSPTKDDQSLEALLDESGEMHETEDGGVTYLVIIPIVYVSKADSRQGRDFYANLIEWW